jgi:hypothetical protein
MKRNDFILSLKQGFKMEHTLEPISVSRWPFIASLGGILRFMRYTVVSKLQRKSNSWIMLALGNLAKKQKSKL